MINDHNIAKTRVWKMQIPMHVNFNSSKGTEEVRTIDVWSDNKNIMWGNNTDNIIDELFESFLNNYRKEKEIMREGSGFVFESVELLDYYLHKVSLKRGESQIKSLEWLINVGATINPKNIKDDKCFQYATVLPLNQNKIERKELGNIFEKIKHEIQIIHTPKRLEKVSTK